MDKIMFIEENANVEKTQKLYLELLGCYNIEKALLWMTEELGEVVSAIRKNKSIEEITGEIGDLITWIFAISNILGISVSEAIKSTCYKEYDRQIMKYGKLKYAKNFGN